jgi:hypothetical protein
MCLVSPFTHNRLVDPLSPVPSLHNGPYVRADKAGTKFPSLPAELAEIDFFLRTAFTKYVMFHQVRGEKSIFFAFFDEKPFV